MPATRGGYLFSGIAQGGSRKCDAVAGAFSGWLPSGGGGGGGIPCGGYGRLRRNRVGRIDHRIGYRARKGGHLADSWNGWGAYRGLKRDRSSLLPQGRIRRQCRKLLPRCGVRRCDDRMLANRIGIGGNSAQLRFLGSGIGCVTVWGSNRRVRRNRCRLLANGWISWNRGE